ncbi:ABC transporter permease [Ferrovibrio sp.]|uniref:ABC transporter permease n=1 Tax=Ferrovibrio sp. TaxID=1917215 RepID=UPI003D28F7FE
MIQTAATLPLSTQATGLLASLRFALFMAGLDIAASFRRTGLGTLWVTVGMVLVVGALGLFFGTVLQQLVPPYAVYVPFLATGMIAWSLIAGMLHATANQTWQFMAQLRHTALPLPATVLRLMLRQLLILVQNLVVALIAQWLLLNTVTVQPLELLGGIVLLAANLGWMALAIGLLCARFRDLPQLVAWMLHLAFFLTPILWPAYFLGHYTWLADINPFHHLVELVRLPLLGQAIPLANWGGSVLLLLFGSLFTRLLYTRLSWRLPYWT